MISRINDFGFLTMVWCTHAIQSGREDDVPRERFSYPQQAASRELLSGYSIQPWEIKTLVNLMLTTPKAGYNPAQAPTMDTRQFESIRVLTNLLRSAEDAETPLRINNVNIIDELHRIGHRQFPWQRTWVRSSELYKYLYIYCQGECAQFFRKTYNLNIIDYVTSAFILFTQHMGRSWMPILDTKEKLAVSLDDIAKTTKLLSSSVWRARHEARQLVSRFEAQASAPIPLAYQPSYLRLKPILSYDHARGTIYTAPLPDLIMLRATAGLFYDLAPGGTEVINDANARFEEYSRRIIKAHLSEFDPLPSERYRHNKNPVDTPDVLLKLKARL
jgi:hypothetical protein